MSNPETNQHPPTPNDETCSICFDNVIGASDWAPSCSHNFCLTCMGKYIQVQVDNGTKDIKCLDAYCGRTLTRGEVRQLASERTWTRYMRLLERMQEFEGTENCATCDSEMDLVFGLRHGYGLRCSNRSCQSFTSRYSTCPFCWETVYGNGGLHRCKAQSESESNIIEGIRKRTIKPCPRCLVPVERVRGCKQMVCRCRQRFCWDCGRKTSECCCRNPHALNRFMNGIFNASNLSVFALAVLTAPMVYPFYKYAQYRRDLEDETTRQRLLQQVAIRKYGLDLYLKGEESLESVDRFVAALQEVFPWRHAVDEGGHCVIFCQDTLVRVHKESAEDREESRYLSASRLEGMLKVQYPTSRYQFHLTISDKFDFKVKDNQALREEVAKVMGECITAETRAINDEDDVTLGTKLVSLEQQLRFVQVPLS